jgi:Tfp pilus assembly protein PilF
LGSGNVNIVNRRVKVNELLWSLLLVFAYFLPAAMGQNQPAGQAAQHYEQGQQFLKQQNWKAAADEFEQVLKLVPEQADTHLLLGVAQLALGETERAQQ